jgi:hypothetical protein
MTGPPEPGVAKAVDESAAEARPRGPTVARKMLLEEPSPQLKRGTKMSSLTLIAILFVVISSTAGSLAAVVAIAQRLPRTIAARPEAARRRP